MSLVLRITSTDARDRWFALGAAVSLGCGIALILSSAAGGEATAAIIGGAIAALALGILIAAEWIDPTIVIALSLPLPAIYSTPDLRIAAAAPVTAIVVFAHFVGASLSRRDIVTIGIPRRATAALAAIFVLAGVFSEHLGAAAREIVNFGVLIALLLVATDAMRRDPSRIPKLIALLVFLAAAAGVLAVFEMLGIVPGTFPRWGTPYFRAAGGFGQPNALGLFLAMLIPLVVYQMLAGRTMLTRCLGAFALLCATAGLVATFSRGSWLSVLAGSTALALAGRKRLVFRILLSALLAMVFIEVLSGGLLSDTVRRTLDDWVIEQRASLMLVGVLMFIAHPAFGVGPGGFAEELDRFGAQIPQLFDYLPTPHNAYIQMAAETGVLGLVSFLIFLFASLSVMVRSIKTGDASRKTLSLRAALLWSFGTVCFAGFVVWPFSHGTGEAVMLIAAAGFALKHDGAQA